MNEEFRFRSILRDSDIRQNDRASVMVGLILAIVEFYDLKKTSCQNDYLKIKKKKNKIKKKFFLKPTKQSIIKKSFSKATQKYR